MLLFGSQLLSTVYSKCMELGLTTLKEENLHKLLGIFLYRRFVSSSLLICSVIYLYWCGLMAIYFKL